MTPEFNQLAQFISQYHKFTNEELELISTKFKLVELKKQDYLFRSGQTIDHVGYIVEGMFYATYDSPLQRKEIPYIVPKGHFISEINGLYLNQPAYMNIQAATTSKILLIELAQLEELKQQIGSLECTIDKINIQELAFVALMLSFPKKMEAKDKYIEVQRRFPVIVSEIPDNILADFLGVSSKSHFSREKNKVNNGR